MRQAPERADAMGRAPDRGATSASRSRLTHGAAALVPVARDAAAAGDSGAASARILDALVFAVTNAVTYRHLLVWYDAFRRACAGGAADAEGGRRLQEGIVPEDEGEDARESP